MSETRKAAENLLEIIQEVGDADYDPHEEIIDTIQRFLDAAYERGKRDAVRWQPIETAPINKDVLLYCPYRGIANEERIELGCAVSEHNSAGSIHSWATHWMPLPQPPEESRQ